MVQVLEKVPSLGEKLGQGLGLGVSAGLGKAGDLATQLAYEKEREKLKRGTLLEQGKAGIPSRFKEDLRGKGLSPKEQIAQQLMGEEKAQGIADTEQPKEQRGFLTPEKLEQEAASEAQRKLNLGIPTTFEEELSLARQKNADIAQQRAIQREYGQLATESIEKLMPEATDEQRAILQRRIENLSNQGLSEAEIRKAAGKEATKFKNQISSVRKSLPPKRLFTKIKEGLLGTGREAEKARDAIRIRLKPLLDEGLYDTARTSLKEIGYYPEETEEIISSLGEIPKRELTSFTPVKPENRPSYRNHFKGKLDEGELQNLSSNLENILTKDPAANLILLRKAYEDKGVDWRSFKDKLDELILQGKLNLNEDQYKTMEILDEPPLNNLEKILHGLHLRGR